MSYYPHSSGFANISACGPSFYPTPSVNPPNVRMIEDGNQLGTMEGIERMDFVDFHEECNFGFFAVVLSRRFVRESDVDQIVADAISGLRIGVMSTHVARRFTRRTVNVVSVFDDLCDLTPYSVRISRRLSNRFQFIGEDFEFLPNVAKKFATEAVLHDILNRTGMYPRYFPSFMTSSYPVKDMYDRIDRMLRRQHDFQISAMGYSEFFSGYKLRSVGQAIYAMMLRRTRIGGFRYDNINLRLLLMALGWLALASEEDLPVYMLEIYKWLVLGVCDSCVEKVILADHHHGTLYDLSSIGDVSRPFWLENIRITYNIFSHGTDMSRYDFSIHRLDHGAFSVSGIRDLADMHFILRDGVGFNVRLNVYRAIMIRQVINNITRAVRASVFGHHDLLNVWYRDIYRSTGSFDRIDGYIEEFIALAHELPILMPPFKGIILFLFFCRVSRGLVNIAMTSELANNYDIIVRGLFNMHVVDIAGVLSYLLNPNVSVGERTAFLRSPVRLAYLKGICSVE